MDSNSIFQIVLYTLLTIGLMVLVYLGIESIRVVRSVRRLIERVDLLTDIKEWLFFFKKISRLRKKS